MLICPDVTVICTWTGPHLFVSVEPAYVPSARTDVVVAPVVDGVVIWVAVVTVDPVEVAAGADAVDVGVEDATTATLVVLGVPEADVEVFGEWIGFEVVREPLYDPEGARIRS